MVLVFDIGSNKGNKTDLFSIISKKVVSVDPDPRNIEILKSRFFYNNNIIIENKAVSNSIGVEKMYIFEDGMEVNTMNDKWKEIVETNFKKRFEKKNKTKKVIEVETETLNSLIKKYGIPDYIKIDVEGFEEKVISSLTYKIPLISFECNLPEFYEETENCIKYLIKICSSTKFNICHSNKLILNEWCDAERIITEISSLKFSTIEVYCRTG